MTEIQAAGPTSAASDAGSLARTDDMLAASSPAPRSPSESRFERAFPHQPQTRALMQFAAAALVALTVAAAVSAVAADEVARAEAVSDAEVVTRVLTRSVIEPHLEDGLLVGDPRAVARLDDLVVGKITGGSVIRVKLWTPGGRVLYSDDHRQIGTEFPLGPSELEVLSSGRVEAEASDLSKQENVLDQHLGPSLEVYVPVHTPGGQLLLFETYSQDSAVHARTLAIFWPIALISLGALLLLELVQIPLAWSTARRLGRAQRERESLLRKAVASSRLERRRIAADLHDDVVQNLAAMSFNMSSMAVRGRRDPGSIDPESVMDAAATVRAAMITLRGMLVDIHPPSVHRVGLRAALLDLTEPLQEQGITVAAEIPDNLLLASQDAELVHRVAQEALRNVVKHAAARSITLQVISTDRLLTLIVTDNGRGMDPAAAESGGRNGHVGLGLLRDLADDSGATLSVTSAPGSGTSVRLELTR